MTGPCNGGWVAVAYLHSESNGVQSDTHGPKIIAASAPGNTEKQAAQNAIVSEAAALAAEILLLRRMTK